MKRQRGSAVGSVTVVIALVAVLITSSDDGLVYAAEHQHHISPRNYRPVHRGLLRSVAHGAITMFTHRLLKWLS